MVVHFILEFSFKAYVGYNSHIHNYVNVGNLSSLGHVNS